MFRDYEPSDAAMTWQKSRMGRLPQQSITRKQKTQLGISTSALRRKLVCGDPDSEVEANPSP